MSSGNSGSPPRGDPRSPNGQRSTSGGTGGGNNGNDRDDSNGRRDPRSRVQQRPEMPPYMPVLISIATVVLQWTDEMVLYTVMDLLAAHYALSATQNVHTGNLWGTILALVPDDLRNRALNGFAAYQTAVQNGGIVSQIPAATNSAQLDRDAAIHLSWAWRRLNLLYRDEDRDTIEDLGQQIFGHDRWAEETAARAQSPSAE